MFVELKTNATLLAAAAPVNDEVVMEQPVTRSAAVAIATMVIVVVLSIFSSNNWATTARNIVLILGLGAWIITQGWALAIGDALRGFISKILAFFGQDDQLSGTILLILIILVVAWQLNKYRRSPADNKAALVIALLAAAMLFTYQTASDLALRYADAICVPIAEGFFYVFNA